MHPDFDFSEAVGECGVSGSSDGFGGDVDLDVVSIAVKAETMVAYDTAKAQHVQDEEKWTTHRTLGDTLEQRSSGEGAVVYVDKLLSVCEIRFEPGEGSASDAEGGFKAGEKNRVVHGVKSCSEVKEDEDVELARVCRKEEVISDFKEGCFWAVLRDEVGFELSGNDMFQYF